MLQTPPIAVKGREIPTARMRTPDVVPVEAVLGPVGEAGEVIRAGFGVVQFVEGEGVAGAEFAEAGVALVGVRADYGKGKGLDLVVMAVVVMVAVTSDLNNLIAIVIALVLVRVEGLMLGFPGRHFILETDVLD